MILSNLVVKNTVIIALNDPLASILVVQYILVILSEYCGGVIS